MAKKVAYHNTIIDIATGAGKKATITVYDAGTVNLSTIYADEDGGVKSNSFDTDDYGRFSFYADQGRYDIQVSGVGITTYKIEDVPVVATYSIVSEPMSGEHRIKGLRLSATGGIIVTYDEDPEA